MIMAILAMLMAILMAINGQILMAINGNTHGNNTWPLMPMLRASYGNANGHLMAINSGY